jgi:regulator of replication initiation timing
MSLSLIIARDDKVKALNGEVNSLVKQVNAKDVEISQIKASQADISNEELIALRQENERLQKELDESKEREKQARLKAG